MNRFVGSEIWDEPVICSQGGVPYNNSHIEYWKKRALDAQTRLAAVAGEIEAIPTSASLYENANVARAVTQFKEQVLELVRAKAPSSRETK